MPQVNLKGKKKKKKIVMGKIMTPSEGQIYKPSLERGERIKKSFSHDPVNAYFKKEVQSSLCGSVVNEPD